MKRSQDSKKRELIRAYKTSRRRMGVYQIRNIVNDMVLIGSSVDLQSIFNRHRFQLSMGKHGNKRLQAEWNEFGEEKFAFEILDELTPGSDPAVDYREDLAFLEDQWLEQIKPYDERGYNERKRSREEKLRMIIENGRRYEG